MTRVKETAFIIFLLITLLLALVLNYNIRAQENPSSSRKLSVSPGGQLEVELTVGDIIISTGSQNEVEVRTGGEDSDDTGSLQVTRTESGVRVELAPGAFLEDLALNIMVPQEYNLKLRTLGGDISVEGALRGSVSGSTSGGDITLGDVQGKIEMSTAGGSIRTGNITGDASVTTMGGDIIVGNVEGDLRLSTMGGDISVGSVSKTLNAQTNGGDIKLGFIGPNSVARTLGGDIIVENVSGETTLSTAGGSIECNGGKGHIKAQTAGGDVSLRNITGSVNAQSASGDISIELNPSGTGNSSISSAMGDIMLALPDDAKATVNATVRVRGHWDEDSEGDITSDFQADTYTKDEMDKQIKGRYVLNGGGQNISVTAINSDIKIVKQVR